MGKSRQPGRPPIEPDENRLQRLHEAARTVEVAKRDLAKAETARDRLIVDAVGKAKGDEIAKAAGVSTPTVWRKWRDSGKATGRPK
jgi:DNA-binding MurR/RpiR family transcriptional regulator